MKKLLILILLAGLGLSAAAQKGKVLQSRADNQFDKFNFEKAAALYERAYEKNNELIGSAVGAAQSYRMMNDWSSAEEWYAKLVETPGALPEYYYYYAQALRSNEKYDKAKENFDKYAEMNADPAYTASIAMDMADVDELMNAKSRYTVRNASEINSEADDFGPMFYNNGLIFTSNRKGDAFVRNEDLWTQAPFLQLFVAEGDDNGQLTGGVEPLEGQGNGKFHDGPADFSPDGKKMYLTRNNYVNKKATKGDDKTVVLKIFELTKNDDDEWSNLSGEFPYNSDNHSVAHAAISPNGDYMVYTSDMVGHDPKGGNDLYMSKKQGNSWGEPINLGSEINTLGDEMFPYVGSDGTLYFASNGHPGLGGLDIYMAEKKGDAWGSPKNLGAPVNTSMDDFNMIVSDNGLFGYFASNRSSGQGGDDIYYVDIEPQGEIDLIVTAYETRPNDTYKEILPGTEVSITNLYSGETRKAIADKDGKVYFSLERDQQYKLEGKKEPISTTRQYLSTTAEVSTVGVIPPKTMEEELLLMLTEQDVPIVLENIYYDLDKWYIRPDAAVELDKLVKILEDNPTMTIELGSHTDCRASFEYNIELSAKRAESAVRYLIKNGISGKRLLAAGYGETKLVNDCACEGGTGKGRTKDCTDEMHQDNRRTEFTILSF